MAKGCERLTAWKEEWVHNAPMNGKFILLLVGIAAIVAFAGDRRSSAPMVAPAVVEDDHEKDIQAKREMNLGGGVILERAPDGHFYADAQVNGVAVRFLVDSGASVVALTPADAARIGKHVGPGDATLKVTTANGEAAVSPVKLDQVSIGSVSVSQVDAVVAGEGLNISLLGQSFLQRVGTVKIENDRLTFD